MIDQYFDYKHGELEYRSLRFEHEVLDEENYQGNAVVNYTEREIPYTRIIELNILSTEHKIKRLLLVNTQLIGNVEMSLIIRSMMRETMPCLLNIKKKQHKNDKVIFCGRLADYKYYDMHVVIERALNVVEEEFK